MGNKSSSHITIQQAAEFLEIHPSTLRRWVKQEKIIGRKIDRKNWTFRKKDLLNLRKTKEIKPIPKSKNLFGKIMDASNVGISVLKAVRNKKGTIEDFRFEFINRKTAEVFGSINPIGTLLTSYGSEGIEQLRYFKEVIETGEGNSYTRKVQS